MLYFKTGKTILKVLQDQCLSSNSSHIADPFSYQLL